MSSDQQPGQQPASGDLPKIGAPATRALASIGVTTLEQVVAMSADELASLHGVGPRAVGILEAALAEHGLALRRD